MKVAVSATIGERFPTVPALLRRVASCPGSRLACNEERGLQKQFKKASKKKATAWKNHRVMCTEEEWEETQKDTGKYKILYAHVEDFCILFERVERDGVCPGFRN